MPARFVGRITVLLVVVTSAYVHCASPDSSRTQARDSSIVLQWGHERKNVTCRVHTTPTNFGFERRFRFYDPASNELTFTITDTSWYDGDDPRFKFWDINLDGYPDLEFDKNSDVEGNVTADYWIFSVVNKKYTPPIVHPFDAVFFGPPEVDTVKHALTTKFEWPGGNGSGVDLSEFLISGGEYYLTKYSHSNTYRDFTDTTGDTWRFSDVNVDLNISYNTAGKRPQLVESTKVEEWEENGKNVRRTTVEKLVKGKMKVVSKKKELIE